MKGWFLFLGLRRVWPRWVKWEAEFCKTSHSHLWSVLIDWVSWKISFVIYFSFGYLVLGQARKWYWIGILKAMYEGKEQTRGYAPDNDFCDQNSVSMLSQNKLEGYQASLKLRREWHNNYNRTHNALSLIGIGDPKFSLGFAHVLCELEDLLLVIGLLQCLGWTTSYMNISFAALFDSMGFYLYNSAIIFIPVPIHNNTFQVPDWLYFPF